MTQTSRTAEDLLKASLTAGDLGQDAYDNIMGLNITHQLNLALGMSAADNDSVEPYLLVIELDDSSSVSWIDSGNLLGRAKENLRGTGPQAMIDGRKLLLETLDTSKRKSGIMVATYTLNRGLIHGFLTLNEIKNQGLWEMRLPTQAEAEEVLDSHGGSIKNLPINVFVAYGGTPLYGRLIEATVALILKRTEFAQDCEVEAQGSVLSVTDGANRDSVDPGLVREEFERAGLEIMFPMLIGIQNPHEYTTYQETADALGIPKRFVFECDGNNRANIMKAFQTATDTALAASQSSASFSQTALGGFTN